MTIRVLLADDQTLIRAGFKSLVDSTADLEVVGEATTGAEAVELARSVRADVVLMDIRMPEMDGPGALPAPAKLGVLTEREREVLALVAGGLSNDEIAELLYVSPLTAKTHVNRAMTKLGARDRAQLVVFAFQSGLVRPGDPPTQ